MFGPIKPRARLPHSGGDLNQGTNWTPNGVPGAIRDAGGVPRPDFTDGVTWGDEMLFDGRTTGPLAARKTAAHRLTEAVLGNRTD